MEKFNVNLKDKQLSVTTPLLKGNGNMSFDVFDDDKLIVVIKPELTKSNRLRWSYWRNQRKNIVDYKELQLIGKAIENYYTNRNLSQV